MRAMLATLLLVFLTQDAAAQPGKAKADPMVEPNAAPSDMQLLMNLQEFTKQLDEAGFRNIQLVTQGVIIEATDKTGKAIMLIFDPESRIAFQIASSERETTGSAGSSEKAPSLQQE